MPNLLAAALKYRTDYGYSVIPAKKDKRPYVQWEPYQKQAPDEKQIKDWWTKWPDANVAIITGAVSNITVVDIDTEAGKENFNMIAPDTLVTPSVKTPSEHGRHFYFLHQKGVVNKARIIEGTDIRNDGGYVLAPPSKIGDNGYVWEKNLRIDEIAPPRMPPELLEIFCNKKDTYYKENNNSNTSIERGIPVYTGINPQSNKRLQPITTGNMIPEGNRDEVLFNLANTLIRGGMPEDKILYFLKMFWFNCCEAGTENYTAREVQDKLISAMKRHPNIAMDDVKDWLAITSGNFSTTMCHNQLQAVTKKDKKNINTYLWRLKQEGVLESAGNRGGEYRVVDNKVEAEDWMNASTETVDIWLPFNLHNMINLMPGDIVLFAGVPGVGKTAVLLNAAKENLKNANVHYFSSELRPGTFKRRLERDAGTPLEHMKDLKFYQRYDNYADVIVPGRGNINVIDYIKVLDNFYIVGKIFADIAKKLDGAIAIVSLQKQFGSKVALGGMFSQFEPVLSVNLDGGENYSKATITKTKEYKDEYISEYGNMDGAEYHFKIVQGISLIKQNPWHRPQKEM
jgi:hypothetical protein